MPSDVLITPASSKIDFTDGSNATKRLNISGTAFSFNSNLNVLSSTSLGSAFKAEGVNGTLFEVTDDLSNSLLSVNTIGGLPVFEVFANNSIIGGQYGANDFVISGNKIGLGLSNPVNKLSVSGAVSIGASYNVAAPSNGLIVQGDVGIGVTSFAYSNANRANLEMYGSGESLLALRNSTGNSYIQKSGADFYINNTTNGFIAISNNGSERWRITSAGVFESNNAQTIRTSTGDLTLATNAGNGHVILSPHGTGNVGIGAATPISKLDVISAPSANGTIIRVRDTVTAGNESFAGIQFTSSPGTDYIVGKWTTAAQAGLLQIRDQSGNQFVTVNSSGYVGINTNSPSGFLNVKTSNIAGREVVMGDTAAVNGVFRARLDDNSLSFVQLENRDTASTTNHGVGIRFNLSTNASNNSIDAGGVYLVKEQQWTATTATQDSALRFFTTLDGAASEKVRIKSDGNVGIGTTNPSHPLTVSRPTQAAAYQINLNNDAGITNGNYTGIRFSQGDGGATELGNIRLSYFTTGSTALSFGVRNVSQALYIGTDGNVGINTTSPSYKLDVNGTTRFGGIVYNEAVQTDDFNYFNLQPYIESETLSIILSVSGTAPSFVTLTNTTAPFSKVMSVSAYGEAALGDYIPVQAGETIYGEIWAYRATGAVGTAGVLYCGVMRYDKDKKMIDSNAGLNTAPSGYFIAFNQTIPSNSTWTKYSGTLVLPTSHTPYNTSDGGPVRYIRPYIIYNYTAGTILTYIGGWKIRKVELTRDAGPVAVNGSVAIGSNSVNYGRLQISAATTTPTLDSTNPVDVSLIISNSDVAYGTMFATYGDGKGALQQRRTNAATYYNFSLQPHGGDVGIGTLSPTQKLDVVGSYGVAGDSSGILKIRGGLTSATQINFGVSADGGYGWIQATDVGATNNININLNPIGGNIGIGNIAPNNKLAISGSASIGSNYNTAAPTNGLIVEGNVGIGVSTLNAGAKLHVVGNADIGDSTADTGIIVRHGSGSAQYGRIRFYSASTNIHTIHSFPTAWNSGTFLNASAGAMNLQGTNGITFGSWNSIDVAFAQGGNNYFKGNVGIGITVPSATLHVNSTTSGATLLRADGTNGTLFSVVDDLSDSLMSVNNSAGLPVLEVFADDRVVAGQYGANDFVLVNNKLGLGTNNPQYELDIVGPGTNAAVNIITRIRSTASSNTFDTASVIAFTNTTTNVNAYSYIGSRIDLGSAGDNAQALIFATNATNTLPTEKMRIKSDGNVGVGTVSPTYKLHVNGNGYFNSTLQVNSNITLSGGGDVIINDSDGTGAFNSFMDSGVGYIRIDDGGSANGTLNVNSGTLFVGPSSGNVGIGTITPAAKLHVNGSMTFGYGSNATFFTGTAFDASNYLILQNNTDSYGRVGLFINAKTFNGANTPSTNDGWALDPRSGIRFRGWLSGDTDYDTKFVIQHLLANATNAVGDLGIFAKGFSTTLPAFVLTGGGSIGIGTTTPAALLQIGTGTPTSATGGIQFGGDTGTRLYRSASGIVTCSGTIAATFSGNLTGNVTGNVSGTAGGETLGTVTGRGASTSTQITVSTSAGGSMYTGIKSGAGYSDAVSGATFKSITDHPTGGSFAFAAYYNGAPGTGTNSFYVGADGSGYFKSTLTTSVIKGDSGSDYPHSFTNTDSGNVHWTNRLNRLLTSNGTGWQTDGRDPIMALVTSGNSNSLNIANSIGLALHNESQTNNTFSPAITFSNRSNSGSYNTTYAAIIGRKTGQGIDSNWSAGELHFYTMPVGAYENDIPSLIINSAGNVGVGIIAPTSKLNVLSSASLSSVFKTEGINGTLFEVTDDLSNSLMSVNTIGGLPVFEVFANNSIVAGQYGVNDFVISGNKIGLGTASPIYKLDVRDNVNSEPYSVAFFRNTNTSTSFGGIIVNGDNQAHIRFLTGASTWGAAGAKQWQIRTGIGANTDALSIYSWTTGSDVLYINSSGNVGINNTIPNAKLEVSGSLIAGGVNNGSVIFYRNTNPVTIGNTDAVLYVSDRSNSDWGIIVDKTGWDYALRLNVANSSTNAFGIYDGSTYNTLLYGNGGGYFLGDISIGTSSTPSARLRLASSNNSRVLWFTGATTGYTYGQIDNSGGSYYIGMSDNIGQFWGSTPYAGYHATLGTSANIPLTFATNNLIRVLLDNNGNVGIGTTSPAALLQIGTGTPTAVTGGIQFGGDTGTRLYRSSSSTITCSGTIAGTFSGTATNATQLGGVAASSYVRNDVDGTDSTALFRLKTITKSLTVTTSWIDTGIVGADLPDSGAYILTLNVDNYAVNGGHYNETYTGIMYWYAGGTNDLGADEIPLHKSGHAPNGRYINLRTVRQYSGGTNLKLQIISSVTTTGASNYIFKFRRMI